MKTTLLSTLTILISILTTTAQEINPIRMGQFFEQGYGRAQDDWADEESALDIQTTATGLVMSGWVDTEEAGGKNMALWQIDEIGRLTSFGEFGYSGVDQIASAVAPHSTSGYFLAGRQSAFYSDDDHSIINSGDEALIKFVSASGTEAWSLLIDSVGGGLGDDTNQVAVDVINDGNDDFLVLINRQYGEFGLQDFRVMMLSASGNIYWDKKYAISNTNVFAQKIVKRANGHYLILANDVDNGIPLLYEISGTGVYETHEEYPQANAVTCFGITNNTYNQPSSGYRLAGSQDNGADEDGFIMEVDNGLTEQSTNIIENPTTGNERFRDIVAHPTGFLAIGECDNRGEGQRDVWICHLDSLGDTLKVETLGGEETDYGHSVTLVPNVFSAFVAGYNNSYTIEESGNAYLGGIKVDMGLPESSNECKVPRVLFVDKFVQRPDKVEALILGDAAEEDDLIEFAKDNEFTHLALSNLGLIFDNWNNQHGYIKASKDTFKMKLDSFIVKCRTNGIYCGMVTDTTEPAILNAEQYNKDKWMYHNPGKLNFQVLEHEFWNARTWATHTGNTKTYLKPPSYSAVPTSLMNDHFENVWSDHQDALVTLNQYKTTHANFWQVHDYVAYYYHRWGGASNSYDYANNTAAKNKAIWIDNNTEGVHLYYYQNDQDSLGLDFLKTTNSSDSQTPRWRERLNQLGFATDSSVIFPLFSAEYYTSNSDLCGYVNGADKDTTDFLGRFLAGPPANVSGATGTFFDVETEYVKQHLVKYNDQTNYPNIRKIQVNAFSWFKYSCVRDKNFTNKSRIDCPVFTRNPLSVEPVNQEKHNSFYSVYPNPTREDFVVEFTGDHRVELTIIDVHGKIVRRQAIFSEEVVSTEKLDAGIYFLRIDNLGNAETFKIIKQ